MNRTGFLHSPLEDWVEENRQALLEAALTMVQAWINVGCPVCDQQLASYEQWSMHMGGLLEFLDIPGFSVMRDVKVDFSKPVGGDRTMPLPENPGSLPRVEDEPQPLEVFEVIDEQSGLQQEDLWTIPDYMN
jgi:hypothetical protein